MTTTTNYVNAEQGAPLSTWLTVKEAAAYVGFCDKTIRRACQLGTCQGRSKIRPPWRRKTRPLGRWVEWRNAAVRRGRQDAGVAAGWRAFLLCSRRELSPFSSRMWTWWVSRSSSAPVSRSDPKISVHSLKGRFEVTSVDACS